MILLDANILIYANNAEAPQYPLIRGWLEQVLDERQPVGLCWPVIWAFVRIATNSRIWPTPTTPSGAVKTIRSLLAHPGVTLVEPGPRHIRILEEVMTQSQALGSLVSDAVLAAIAIEHGATLASTDNDFSRFENLNWINPMR